MRGEPGKSGASVDHKSVRVDAWLEQSLSPVGSPSQLGGSTDGLGRRLIEVGSHGAWRRQERGRVPARPLF
jgi:hypothetical protein